MTPKRITKEKLLNLLDDIRAGIVADDSAYGTFSYEATPEKHVFDVTAAVHAGWTQGQGSTQFIAESLEDPKPEDENSPTGIA